MSNKDYSTITELPNASITSLQLKRAYQRYMFAREHIKAGKLIEIGCGGGQGLNIFRDVSDEIVGYDIDKKNIEICKNNYRDIKNIKFINVDVEDIKFEPITIQTIIIFETIYYLKNHDNFFKSLYLTLKIGGKVIICTANKNWHSFNPSSFSTKYFSAKELYELGKRHSFDVETFGSFSDKPKSFSDKIKNLMKKIAVRYGLMPKTMKSKLLFKKIFSGKMINMPERIEIGIIDYISPKRTNPLEQDIYSTAIFAVFTKK